MDIALITLKKILVFVEDNAQVVFKLTNKVLDDFYLENTNTYLFSFNLLTMCLQNL